MVIDGNPLCGILLINNLRLRVFDVINRRIVISHYFENFIRRSQGEQLIFLQGLRQKVLEHSQEILILCEQSFHTFNRIVINHTLPKKLRFDVSQQEKSKMVQFPAGLSKWKQKSRTPYFSHDILNALHIIQNFIQHPENYRGRRFYEKFLRVDVMYWHKDKRFYVNEIETWACGKINGENNPDIHSLLFKELFGV
jgi:hypothetical protein